MKKLILALALVMVCGLAFAGYEAEILDVIQDPVNGSIIVKTQYKLDGVEVVSRYPQLDGKYYWVTRYQLQSFAGMDDNEMKMHVLKDLMSFGENLIREAYLEKANLAFIQDNAATLIGTKNAAVSATILLDTNKDGVRDTKWIIFSDGTRTEEAYVEPMAE